MVKDLPTIDIRGKKYVLVSERVKYFNETYPNGSINTELISEPNDPLVIIKATIIPDIENPLRQFSDYSQAVVGDGMVNKTAALENASTSSVGRALGYMGIGVVDSIASADEMNKARSAAPRPLSAKQINWMRSTVKHYTSSPNMADAEVDKIIEEILTIKPQAVPPAKLKDAITKLSETLKDADLDHTPSDDQGYDVTDEDLEQPIDLSDVPY